MKICVVGLGYVGLPLAIEFAKVFPTLGFDINKKRIEQLKRGYDSSGEISNEILKNSTLKYIGDARKIKECNFIVINVPTPITKELKPDLSFVKNASKIVGQNLAKNAIVVYESTVYPGVTEEICAPILEKESGLKCENDFKVGYSPERINPGDREHNVRNIVKIVAGMDKQTTDKIAEVYTSIVDAGVYKTKDIKTAEAAKVIENIQRDLNIALINELSLIFHKLGLNTLDVIDAAATKWNFHKYVPGLVGGHCIGVDPYYLTYKAQEVGYKPKVILAGRTINEYMGNFVVQLMEEALREKGVKAKNVFILGVTFKENVKDIRNSKVKDIIDILKKKEYEVIVYDPLVEDDIIKQEFNVKNVNFNDIGKVDVAILFSPHKVFKKITLEKLKEKLNYPILIDVKSFYDTNKARRLGFIYKNL